MTTDGYPSRFTGDRPGDLAPGQGDPGRRPILRRGTLQGLALVCLAVIIYGTVGPLGVRGRQWIDPLSSWQAIPPWQHSDANDLFTNFLVYIPVGLAFRLLVRRRGRAGMADLVVALGLSAALSYGTEFAQQFMPARSANLQDCLVNALAALVGCLIAPGLQRRLRQIHAYAYETVHVDSWTLLAWAAALVTGGLMVVPLRLASPSMELDWTRRLDMDDVRRFGMFVILGFCVAAAAIQRHGSTWRAVRAAVKPIAALAIGLELAQIFISTHACGLLDMAVALMGGVAGCGMAAKCAELGIIPDGTRNHRARQGRHGRTLQAVALVVAGLFALAFGAHNMPIPARFGAAEFVVNWVPFHYHFSQPFDRVVASLAEMVALYGFITMLCLMVARARGAAVAFMMTIGLATLIESLRLLLGSGVADVTAPLLAFVAWFLTTRIWNALLPRRQPGRERASEALAAELPASNPG